MATIESGRVYALFNVQAGNCVDLSGGDNTSVIGYDYHGGDNQKVILLAFRVHDIYAYLFACSGVLKS